MSEYSIILSASKKYYRLVIPPRLKSPHNVYLKSVADKTTEEINLIQNHHLWPLVQDFQRFFKLKTTTKPTQTQLNTLKLTLNLMWKEILDTEKEMEQTIKDLRPKPKKIERKSSPAPDPIQTANNELRAKNEELVSIQTSQRQTIEELQQQIADQNKAVSEIAKTRDDALARLQEL